jgi:hypothetical protein
MYTPTEIWALDDTLATHGLRADWGSPWTNGNCGWDGLSQQSKVHSTMLRNMAMDALTAHISDLVQGSDEALALEETIQALISEHKERGGFQSISTTNDYIRYMRLRAEDGGLWMDNLSSAWAGTSLHANIEIYSWNIEVDGTKTLTLMPFVPLPPPALTYCLLHTRGPPGHYTPVYPLPPGHTFHTHPRPRRETTSTATAPRPLHMIPQSAPPRRNLPTAIREVWEKQDRRFCWLHAFNMLRRAYMNNTESITPQTIVDWFKKEKTTPEFAYHKHILNDTNPNTRPLDPTSGNFNHSSFAYWAYLSEGTRISSVVPFSPRSLDVDSLIAYLTETLWSLQTNRPSTFNGFILATHESEGYGHATALLFVDKIWYWLDSDPTKHYRAILTGPAGTQNRRELLSIARSLFAADLGAQSLSACPLACVVFPPDPPAPWHNRRIEHMDLTNTPSRPENAYTSSSIPAITPVHMETRDAPMQDDEVLPTHTLQHAGPCTSHTTHLINAILQPSHGEDQQRNPTDDAHKRPPPPSDDIRTAKRSSAPSRSTKNQPDRPSFRKTAAHKVGPTRKRGQHHEREHNANAHIVQQVHTPEGPAQYTVARSHRVP